MAEEIRNKFVSWTLNVVKEIKEVPSSASKGQQQRGGGGRKEQPQKRRGGGGGGGGVVVCGIGVNLSLVPPSTPSTASASSSARDLRVRVDSVAPGGPADGAGIRGGDVVIEVDGRNFGDVRDLVPDEVASAIRGPRGTSVVVVVEREGGGGRLEFAVVREWSIGVGVVPSTGTRQPSPAPAAGKGRGAIEETGASSSSSSSSSSVPRDEQEARGKREEESTAEKHRRWFGGETRAGELPREAARRESDPPAADVFRPASLAPSPRSEAKEEEEEEERKERDMASSAESADQFDGDFLAPPPARASDALVAARRASAGDSMNAASSAEEEKAIDSDADGEGEGADDDGCGDGASSVAGGSVGDASSQWEMLSERSGSAIVVSFSGSYCGSSSCCYRSPSPSVLKNKFVLAESNGEAYMNHVVLPTDTIQGLCLAYKISATRLRMENNFSGNSLHMAPKRLRIPNAAVVGTALYEKDAIMVRTQDRTSREFKLYAFVAEMPSMELVEAKAYLDLSNWDLDEAIRSAREDEGWSLKGGFEPLGGASSATVALGDGDDATTTTTTTTPFFATMKMDAVAKPKTLTARDIYACPPPFDGHGFELKDIRR